MEYRRLTAAEYDLRLRLVIVGAEGHHPRAVDLDDGKATIGWGYTLNRNNNVAIWSRAGIELTNDERAALAAVDAAASGNKTRRGLAFRRELSEDESDRLLRASIDEYEAPANRLGMPLSEERIALVSLAYNRGTGNLDGVPASNIPEHPVMQAIRDGDRAEAWFQIRYNCWGSNQPAEAGLRKRRFAEAHVFGLYDDPAAVPAEEARTVLRMLELHRSEIDRVESRFGVTVDGAAAARDRIAQANRDYPALVREYGRIPTIDTALEPARAAVLADLQREHPWLADAFDADQFGAGRIHLDPGRALSDGAGIDVRFPVDTPHDGVNRRNRTIRHEQHNATTALAARGHDGLVDARLAGTDDATRAALLIGEGGDDTLRAHDGDDILHGGSGRNRLEGGAGHDLYLMGAGDIILDADGRGALHWGDHRLDGGARADADPAGTYRSADGRFEYRRHGTALHVTDLGANTQGTAAAAVIHGFRNGHLGIHLEEARGNVRVEPGDRNDPDDPAHPDHALLLQIRDRVGNLGAGAEDASERICRGLLVACKAHGDPWHQPGRARPLERVDHVIAGRDGRLFAIEGRPDDPAHRRVTLDTMDALATPLAVSDARLAAANLALAAAPADIPGDDRAQGAPSHTAAPGAPVRALQ